VVTIFCFAPLKPSMNSDPIFVLSAPRSGSTLLRVMLAGHRQLFSPPELHLLSYQSMQEREAALGPCPWGSCPKDHDCDQRHGLQRALMELKGIDDIASQQMIAMIVKRDDPIARVYELLDSLAAPRRLVDKSPSYSAHVEIMQRAQKLFPQALYIYLYRHPYAVIDSIVRIQSQSLAKAEAMWTTRNGNIRSFLAGIGRDQQIYVAYEALVHEPERVMRELSAFLGVEFDFGTIRPYEGSRMTDGVRPGCLLPGDWNFHSHQAIDPRRADVWRNLDLPQPLGDDGQHICRGLGYEIPVAVSRPL
jgi:Sulfotransferase family